MRDTGMGGWFYQILAYEADMSCLAKATQAAKARKEKREKESNENRTPKRAS